jgi:hypothetical protein
MPRGNTQPPQLGFDIAQASEHEHFHTGGTKFKKFQKISTDAS